MYVLEYTPNAIKDLRSLDKVISGRILKKIKKYSESANALVTAKALLGNMNGFYRWRVGDYRMVFCRWEGKSDYFNHTKYISP